MKEEKIEMLDIFLKQVLMNELNMYRVIHSGSKKVQSVNLIGLEAYMIHFDWTRSADCTFFDPERMTILYEITKSKIKNYTI